MADSLGKILEAGHWEKALFTTYSLSLTFFESIILRALRKVDCREIWVISDAEGYRSCLMERGSIGVGNEYHVIPIGLRRGVFHPKCCYLVGAEGDLLIIGSGNLTFGGLGRNLEVLDVLSSRIHGECFSIFAGFLAGLSNRQDVICPDFGWAEFFANRAREVSSNTHNLSEYPKLVTSLEKPIKDQLGTLIATCGEAANLTVLSPFFDPDGSAVLELARETNTPEVRIALPPGTELTSFPFPKARRWPVKLSAVKLYRKEENRRLHAKWIEWDTTSGVLTLTGSINATRQALCDKNNIEVGVLRLAASGKGWAKWRKASLPTSYRVLKFKQGGIGSSRLVFAELLDSGELRGHMVSVSSSEGIWFGTIEKPNGDSIEVEVKVQSDGRFSNSTLTISEDFLFASGLQIRLEQNGKFARGWITNVTILNLPKSQRISASSLLRLINREETEDDDIAFLEYLAMHALDHLRTFQSRVTRLKDSAEDSPSETYSISLGYLKPDANAFDLHRVSRDPIISAGLALERVFAQIRRRLLGHVPQVHRAGQIRVDPSDDSEEDLLEEDAQKPNPSRERFESAFDYFMESMADLAQTATMADEHRRAVLVLWVEVALHMLGRRKRDRAGAITFLRGWFWRATSLTSITGKTDSLSQHIVTTAAILAAVDSTSQSRRQDLHEALEHYWRGAVDVDRARSELLPASPLSIAALFLDLSETTLEDSRSTVLNTITVRHELEQVLIYRQYDSIKPETSRILQSEAGRELGEHLRLRGKAPQMEFLRNDEFVCPSQFIRLSEACRGELQRNRIAHCSVCGSLIVRMAP